MGRFDVRKDLGLNKRRSRSRSNDISDQRKLKKCKKYETSSSEENGKWEDDDSDDYDEEEDVLNSFGQILKKQKEKIQKENMEELQRGRSVTYNNNYYYNEDYDRGYSR